MTDLVIDLAVAALSCLSQAVSGLPGTPANICYRVGLDVAHDLDMVNDLCCEGLAYVALGDTYPSSASFPDQDIIRQANAVCPPVSWAQTLKFGIVRCIPVVMDDFGTMPSCADWNTAALQNMYDSIALRRTACCFREFISNNTGLLEGMSVVIDRQTQGSPIGGCVERSMTINVQMPNCDC
jgi:hypothetical protein